MAASSNGVVYINPEMSDYIPMVPVPGPSSDQENNRFVNCNDDELRNAKYGNRRLIFYIDRDILNKSVEVNTARSEIKILKKMINKIITGTLENEAMFQLRTKRQMSKEKMINLLMEITKLIEVKSSLQKETLMINRARRLRKQPKIERLTEELGYGFELAQARADLSRADLDDISESLLRKTGIDFSKPDDRTVLIGGKSVSGIQISK